MPQQSQQLGWTISENILFLSTDVLDDTYTVVSSSVVFYNKIGEVFPFVAPYPFNNLLWDQVVVQTGELIWH